MSVNLTKNKDSLVDAWHSVVDDKSSVNWAVFGYEGQTNNLEVVGSGSGGLEEMIEELNSGHIMYAFCRVVDTKTSLPKCILINWQGECAPIVRKGMCANHTRDIEKLLKGAHITVNARSEEEVEVEPIMEKLARATGSSYRFNEPRGKNGGNAETVGTTYRRVIPEQEINASERDRFWQREEIEEKQRVEQERLRLEKDRQRLEFETRWREEEASKLREQQQVSTSERVPPVEKKSEQRAAEIKNLRNQQIVGQQNDGDSDDERRSRSDELRKQRSDEAQQLIAQRTINARAVFEQNSSAGQMRQNSPQNMTKFSSAENSISSAGGKTCDASRDRDAKRLEKFTKIFEGDGKSTVMNEKRDDEEITKFAMKDSRIPVNYEITMENDDVKTLDESGKMEKTMKSVNEIAREIASTLELAAPIDDDESMKINKSEEKNVESCNNGDATNVEETTEESLKNAETELYNQLSCEEPYLSFDPNTEGMKARALYDYQAADDTEITFDPGDIITHIDTIDDGWWQGLGPDGTYGLFPANYVEVIKNDAT